MILATCAMKGIEILALMTHRRYPSRNPFYLGYKFKENMIQDTCQRMIRWILLWSPTAGGIGMTTRGSSIGDRGGLNSGANEEKCKQTTKAQVGVRGWKITNRKQQG